MTWQEETIPMLRVLINDNDATDYTYTDDRLEEVLVVAAKYVTQEITITTSYTVSVSSTSISPDPGITTSDDNTVMMNMMVLKAACITDFSTFRTKALIAGVEAKCGPAVIRTLKHIDGFKQLLTDGPCAAYKELKQQHNFGNTDTLMAIMSPFVSNDFDPQSLGTSGSSSGIGRGHDTGFLT